MGAFKEKFKRQKLKVQVKSRKYATDGLRFLLLPCTFDF